MSILDLIRTGDQLDATEFSTAPTGARDVVMAGYCTPPCLLALEDGACVCRCQGEYHGSLAAVEIHTRSGLPPYAHPAK